MNQQGQQPSARMTRGPVRVRRRYHLGAPGLVYIFLTLLVALGAFNSQNNLLFWAFGFGLSLLVVSGFLSGAMLMGLDFEREPVAPGTVGEPLSLHYRLTNRNRVVPAFALSIAEVAPIDAGTRKKFRTRLLRLLGLVPPDRPGVNWTAHLSRALAFVPYVGARQTVHGEAVVLAEHRGRFQFGSVLVSTSFPFGIVKKSLMFEQPQHGLVRPRVAGVEPGILARAVRQGDRGTTPTRRSGPGEEFFALREYVPGDAPRGIAWRASARGGRLLVRQTAAPSPIRVWVGLHFGPPTGSAEDDESAISLAAGLISMAISRGMEVGLFAPEAGILAGAHEGRRQREELMDQLAGLEVRPSRFTEGPRPAVAWDDGLGSEAAAFVRAQIMCIVVHSGPVDTTWGPPKAMHFRAKNGIGRTAPGRSDGPADRGVRQRSDLGRGAREAGVKAS